MGSSQNVQSIVVNAGPANTYFNGAFTSVTVCAPGTSSCQTIDGVLVDSGSSGLRLLSSVLTLSLPQQTDAGGAAMAECGQFLDGFTWGPVQTADIRMAGEQASAVPIQVIGAPGFSSVPAACSSIGPAEDTLQDRRERHSRHQRVPAGLRVGLQPRRFVEPGCVFRLLRFNVPVDHRGSSEAAAESGLAVRVG